MRTTIVQLASCRFCIGSATYSGLEDYFWLCQRKKSKLSLSERARFQSAPLLMDFRKSTDTNLEDNCDFFTRMRLRSHARELKVPILSIAAVHENTGPEGGMTLDDDRFGQLPKYVEIAENAPNLFGVRVLQRLH